MSSILKALKKVEEEKGDRQGGSSDFARNLLRSEYRRPRSSVRPLLGGVALLLSLLLAGVWWINRPATPPLQPPTVMEGPLESQPAVAVQAPQLPMASEPQGNPALPIANAEVLEVIFSVPAIQGASSRVVPVDAVLPPVAVLPMPEIPQAQSSAVGKSSTWPVLSLQLSGIAWQEERDARLAIVDDLPIMEGTMIDGYLVEEILRDRVRFSRNGQIFELLVE
jgi:general secretion pathway protein B